MTDVLLKFIQAFLHLDKYLQTIVDQYSGLTYLLLFLIVFLETGIVVAPFLPGDSLLFTAGALSAVGSFRLDFLFIFILIASVLGDTANYHIGKAIGPKIFSRETSRLFHKEHLIRAQNFYDKHGRKTIVLARFIPIIRTFAPFVAGIGVMSYGVFLVYNVIGAVLWCSLFVFGGFYFGNIPLVKENFGLFIIFVILISLSPLTKEIIYHFFRRRKNVR